MMGNTTAGMGDSTDRLMQQLWYLENVELLSDYFCLLIEECGEIIIRVGWREGCVMLEQRRDVKWWSQMESQPAKKNQIGRQDVVPI